MRDPAAERGAERLFGGGLADQEVRIVVVVRRHLHGELAAGRDEREDARDQRACLRPTAARRARRRGPTSPRTSSIACCSKRRPARRARAPAPSISGDESMPSDVAPAAAARRGARVSSPVPQPRSTTRRPGRTSISANEIVERGEALRLELAVLRRDPTAWRQSNAGDGGRSVDIDGAAARCSRGRRRADADDRRLHGSHGEARGISFH